MKRRSLVVLLLAVSIIVFVCAPAFAAPSGGGGGTTKYPWNIPANMRIVQKDTADNVRIFTTIQAAINSIPQTDPNTEYVIKVMPGIYAENITLTKAYLRLQGSGSINTRINGTATGTSGNCNGVTFEDMHINEVNSYCQVAIKRGTSGRIQSTLGTLILEDAQVGGDIFTAGYANIKRSMISGIVHLTGYAGDGLEMEDVTIIPPYAGTEFAMYLSFSAQQNILKPAVLKNIRVKVYPTSIPPRVGLQIASGVDVRIYNSDFVGSDYGIAIDNVPSLVSIFTSQVQGGLAAVGGTDLANHTLNVAQSQLSFPPTAGGASTTKIVNCYDTDFNPIPNQ